MKKISLFLLALICLSVQSYAAVGDKTIWTFTAADIKNSAEFNATGSNTFVGTNGAELVFSASSGEAIVSSSATISTVEYTNYLKINGGGSATKRNMTFDAPSANGKLTIVFAGTVGGTYQIDDNDITEGEKSIGTISPVANTACVSNNLSTTVGHKINIYNATKCYIYSVIWEETAAAAQSDDATCSIIVNSTVNASQAGTTFSAELHNYANPTVPVVITPNHDAAVVTVNASASAAGQAANAVATIGTPLNFSVTAEDGTVVNYTLTVTNVDEVVINTVSVWDYTTDNPTSSPDNGLYYASKVGTGTGIKINSTGYAHFNTNGVAGKLLISFKATNDEKTAKLTVYTDQQKSAYIAGAENLQQTTAGVFDTKVIDVPAGTSYIYIAQGSTESVINKIIWAPSLTVGTAGYSTYCAPFNYTVTGATAYKASVADEYINLTALEGIIPAGAGIILGGEGNVTITPTSEDANADMTGNQLKGTTTAITTPANAYVLKANQDEFAPFTGATIPANKAYLVIPVSAPLRMEIVPANPVATDIQSATALKVTKALVNGKIVIVKNGAMFNLNGMLVK